DIEFSKPANNPGNMWVEYQVYAPETRQYTLTLRYTASENSSMTIRVDGDLSGSTWLYTSDQWADKTAAIVMSAGKHTIRFIITGTCALNRLKIE
ncbi:MAG: carbohydrate-binding protein, partial [Treponema sp.]|nr:carbohydrate-binding protein [Treponema sp.]